MTNAFADRLAGLRRLDSSLRIFGAGTHRYRSTPVGPEALVRFEAALGISLPAEYRQFLLETGYGAGPYYGVWNPEESLDELRCLSEDYAAETGQTILPAADFPLTVADRHAIEATLADGGEFTAAERNWPCGGCLPICHQGCTFWSVLVLTGEFAGRVWDVANYEGFFGQWGPARRPSGVVEFGAPRPKGLPRLPNPPTFNEWYGGWLERCLTDLGG